ncbi:class I SAM-dependent methyltransferase [Pirellulaceae bacterium SH449]
MFEESDYEWLACDETIQIWQRMHATNEVTSIATAEPTSLESKRRMRLLREQGELAALAKNKFPESHNWFWTRTLLEQASDRWCANETAADFPSHAEVVDICCGAGADTLALAARCKSVRAIDAAATSVHLLKANAKLQNRSIQSSCQLAEEVTLHAHDYLHIDPDRRTTGKRVTAVEGLQPSWPTVRRLVEEAGGSSIKVAPATPWSELEILPEVVRFLSRDRSVRQQRWLWGLERWPRGSIVVSVLSGNTWVHEVFLQSELDTACSRESLATDVAAFVADYDPGLRAARVSGLLAERIGCQMLDSAGGYFTANACHPHGMVRWFRSLDLLTMDAKKLRAYARSAGVGVWELKSRGVAVDLDKLRKDLPTTPGSERTLTLLFAKVCGRPRVIVAEPVGGWGNPLSN